MAGTGFQQLPGVGEASQFPVQGFGFAGLWREVVQFLKLKTQEFQPGLPVVAGADDGFDVLLYALPVVVQGGKSVERGAVFSMPVE